jgi:hypothetical protein
LSECRTYVTMHRVRVCARRWVSVVAISTLLLPGIAAAAASAHALEHATAGALSPDLAALATHGHGHPAATPEHDHGATFGAGKPAFVAPVAVIALLPVAARTTDPAPLRPTVPRSRGSGDDLLLRLSCVLLL